MNPLRNERGMALVIVMAMLVMISLIGIAAVRNSSTEMDIAEALIHRTKSFYTAEAGLELAVATMRANPDMVNKDSLLSIINVDSVLGDGSFQVQMANTYPIRTVSSFGHDVQGEAGVAVDVYHSRTPINAWNNAIFAGVGQSGRGIAGNVDIHGSVHILGDGEPFTDDNGNDQWDDVDEFTDLNGDGIWQAGEPLTLDHDGDGLWDVAEPFIDDNGNGTYDETLLATDLSFEAGGTSAIQNNYSGLPALFASRLPPLSTIPFNGEMVQTLDAEIRVKHGRVNLSGAAHIGEPDVSGGAPAQKETMDNVYVNDGYGGTAGVTQIYSDNGTANGYDIPGDAIKFPSQNDSVAGYATHRAWLAGHALVISGDLEIKPGVAYTSPASTKGSINVDAAGNITISGIVVVTGEVYFSAGKGALRGDPLVYDGRGTIVSGGDMHINTHVISKGDFPSDDVMGFIAGQNLELGTGAGASHLDLMGAFYAQQTIINEKQNMIAGATVSNYFQVANVPSIYQVPALVDNLPPGMPGGVTFNILVWRELASTWREL